MRHHRDHLGGIRTAIDEGATIVTHHSNRMFLEWAATAPHTIRPDNFDLTIDMLLYLPKEKVLAEADAFTPPDTPTTPLIAPKVLYATALDDNIRHLKVDVQTTVPFRGMRTADLAEVVRHGGPR